MVMYKRCDIKDWLDDQIRFWGQQRDQSRENGDHDTATLAIHYIDAYQETRLAIFEEALEPAVR